MADADVKTYKATAAELDVSLYTVSDLARKIGLQPKRMLNGNAKGLDANDRAIMRERLEPATCNRRPSRRRPTQAAGA